MKNIGVDIVENSRFKTIINDKKKVDRFLSDKELVVFNNLTSDIRKIEYLASRFSAKEAVIKAISYKGLSYSYKDISILNNENGSPYVLFSFPTNFKILISISHAKENSIAFVLVEEE